MSSCVLSSLASLIILVLFLSIFIQIVHAENFQTFFHFLQSLRDTTKASPSQHYPLSLPDNNTHSDTTKHETKTSSTTIGLIALIFEIVLILILFLIKLLYKLANNNWKFKRSWIEIKSMDEYRQRFHKKKAQERAVLDVIDWISTQRSTTLSTADSIEEQYSVSIV